MKSEDLMNYATLAAVGVGLFLVYKGYAAVGKAGSAAADAISGAAGAVNDGVSAGVGAIGSMFGLPTPAETLDNPAQVRWIIDHVGSYSASTWATAGAYVSALGMPAGSGDNNPPPDAVLRALGIAPSVALPNTTNAAVDFITSGQDYSGSMLGGTSFNDMASGSVANNPFRWY